MSDAYTIVKCVVIKVDNVARFVARNREDAKRLVRALRALDHLESPKSRHLTAQEILDDINEAEAEHG